MPANTRMRVRKTESAITPRQDAAVAFSWKDRIEQLNRDPRRAARWMSALLVILMIAFSIAPILNNLRGAQNKDYNLWYWTGQAELHGWRIYPTDHRPFPFMYPPSCALLFAATSVAGETPCVVLLLLVTSASWIACILLSVYLTTGKAFGQHPYLYVIPSLVVIPFVHDMYLLGQPALLLLACLLGAFACLRVRRPWAAGGLIGLAAAIKAFPILAVAYLVYRRQWKATLATVVTLALLLIVIPTPLRGPKQAWEDLSTWTRGMVLKYDEGAIAQRPERSYSFKNQSLIALANRLLRAVPADGEAKDGWQVNVADLDFPTVNAVIVASALILGGFYLAAMPHASRRTEQSDALETAMLLVLILAFTPLSFDYNYIWLMYPLTLLIRLILESPAGSRQRDFWLLAFTGPLVLMALALPFRREAEAHGNLLLAGLLIVFALGCELWGMTHRSILNLKFEISNLKFEIS